MTKRDINIIEIDIFKKNSFDKSLNEKNIKNIQIFVEITHYLKELTKIIQLAKYSSFESNISNNKYIVLEAIDTIINFKLKT